MDQATAVEEVLRLPSPAPAPQALACAGEHLWMGSWETQRIYGLDRAHFTVFEESPAPGKPVGMVAIGEELRVILSEGGDEDHRFIRRYVPGHGFKEHDKIACPEDTGSFLAYDGESLWLSQRYNRRVLQVDAAMQVKREVRADAQILGITFANGALYVSLWYGKEIGAKLGRVNGDKVEAIATMRFAAISLAFDGSHFWCNDPKTTSIVAFRV